MIVDLACNLHDYMPNGISSVSRSKGKMTLRSDFPHGVKKKQNHISTSVHDSLRVSETNEVPISSRLHM